MDMPFDQAGLLRYAEEGAARRAATRQPARGPPSAKPRCSRPTQKNRPRFQRRDVRAGLSRSHEARMTCHVRVFHEELDNVLGAKLDRLGDPLLVELSEGHEA